MLKQVQSLTTQLLFDSSIKGGRWIIYTPHCHFWHDSFCQASWYTIFGNVAVLCVTKLIHHCCQRTLSLQNAFRNFQQHSLERKHGIVLKKYSPEDNQKSKLAKKKAQTIFPLKCVLLLLHIFMKSAVHLGPEGFFCFVFLCMCSYILYCFFYCHACTGKQPVLSLLCWEAGSYFFSLNNSFSHLQKKRCLISEILFHILKILFFLTLQIFLEFQGFQ